MSAVIGLIALFHATFRGPADLSEDPERFIITTPIINTKHWLVTNCYFRKCLSDFFQYLRVAVFVKVFVSSATKNKIEVITTGPEYEHWVVV